MYGPHKGPHIKASIWPPKFPAHPRPRAPTTLHSFPVQIDKCFGFDTAVEEAQRALLAAKVEASSAYHGIGLVKLMGRQSGFIGARVRF